MALHIKHNVFVIIRDSINLPEGKAYNITMPSGLNTLAWASDLLFI